MFFWRRLVKNPSVLFFSNTREGGRRWRGTEGRGGGRRPRPGAAAAAATAKNPRPKQLLKSRGGARRNASSDTRAQAAQRAPAGRSKHGLRRLQEGTQPRAPQGRNGDEIEQDRCRSRAAARRGGKGWSERTRERRSRRASGAETSRRSCFVKCIPCPHVNNSQMLVHL